MAIINYINSLNMSRKNQYDPEDLEKLLSTKSFSELLPEEKAFVLQYIDSDLEYDSLRETFSVLGTLPDLEPAIVPKDETKAALMAAFEEEKDKAAVIVPMPEGKEKKGFWAWFWNKEKSVFGRPALQLASLALVFTVGYFFISQNTVSDMAEHTNEKIETQQTEASDRSDVRKKNLEVKTADVKNAVEGSFEELKDKNNSEPEKAEFELNEIEIGSTDNTSAEGFVISNNITSGDVTFDVTDSSGNTAIAHDTFTDDNFGIDAKVPDLGAETEELDFALDEVEEDFAEDFDEEFKALKDKEETIDALEKKVDTSFYKLVEGEAIASDYRDQIGNSTFNMSEVSVSRTATTAMDSPSAKFDMDVDDDSSAPALAASNFGNLLNKLYTSQ